MTQGNICSQVGRFDVDPINVLCIESSELPAPCKMGCEELKLDDMGTRSGCICFSRLYIEFLATIIG